MKRRTIIILTLLFVFVFSSCDSSVSTDVDTLTEVRLPVGYIPNVQFAPLYVAMENGYFEDAGFDVNIDYNYETDAVTLVGTNEIPFAIASGDQVLLARQQGLPVVYVAAWYQDYPVGIVSFKESNAIEPPDLAGKTIGTPMLSGASYIGLQVLLSAGGLTEDDISLDVVGFNQVELMTSGELDHAVIYVANEPAQLEAMGYEVDVIHVSDHLKLVSNGLITNEKTIAENPDMVRRMVGALVRGIETSLEDLDETYTVCEKYVENLSSLDENETAIQKKVLEVSSDYWKADRIGYSDPQAWRNMDDVLAVMGLVNKNLILDDVYSNDFLPEETE